MFFQQNRPPAKAILRIPSWKVKHPSRSLHYGQDCERLHHLSLLTDPSPLSDKSDAVNRSQHRTRLQIAADISPDAASPHVDMTLSAIRKGSRHTSQTCASSTLAFSRGPFWNDFTLWRVLLVLLPGTCLGGAGHVVTVTKQVRSWCGACNSAYMSRMFWGWSNLWILQPSSWGSHFISPLIAILAVDADMLWIPGCTAKTWTILFLMVGSGWGEVGTTWSHLEVWAQMCKPWAYPLQAPGMHWKGWTTPRKKSHEINHFQINIRENMRRNLHVGIYGFSFLRVRRNQIFPRSAQAIPFKVHASRSWSFRNNWRQTHAPAILYHQVCLHLVLPQHHPCFCRVGILWSEVSGRKRGQSFQHFWELFKPWSSRLLGDLPG